MLFLLIFSLKHLVILAGFEVRKTVEMASSSFSVLFTRLERFTDSSSTDLQTWLKNFDRCCVIANKTDDLVKGQLLMMFVEGQAKAILEEFEEEKGTPQNYTALVQKLKSYFDTVASRETKMAAFESRTQNLDESEEEFMFALVKLFRTANPGVTGVHFENALKRKFLQGISPELKKNLFVFCNNPYDETITRTALLEFTRNAKVHLSTTESFPNATTTTTKVLTASEQTDTKKSEIMSAIHNLSLQFDQHIAKTETKFQEQDETLAAVFNHRGGDNRSRFNRSSSRGMYNRGRGRENYYRGRNENSKWQPNQNKNESYNENIRCYNCGEPNHMAKHCLSKKSGNF